MDNRIAYSEKYNVARGSFDSAGEASFAIKRLLKKLGVSPQIIREVSIASYELELNLVIHSNGGALVLEMNEDRLCLTSEDTGPGIADTKLAMTEGYSTAPEDVRMMGFGAGMGLPNVKRHSHEFSIESALGSGTTIRAVYHLK